MSFIIKLVIIYALMGGTTVFAFIKKKKMAGIILSIIMVVGIVILGYLWITSPM